MLSVAAHIGKMLFGKAGNCFNALLTVEIAIFHYAFYPHVNGERVGSSQTEKKYAVAYLVSHALY